MNCITKIAKIRWILRRVHIERSIIEFILLYLLLLVHFKSLAQHFQHFTIGWLVKPVGKKVEVKCKSIPVRAREKSVSAHESDSTESWRRVECRWFGIEASRVKERTQHSKHYHVPSAMLLNLRENDRIQSRNNGPEKNGFRKRGLMSRKFLYVTQMLTSATHTLGVSTANSLIRSIVLSKERNSILTSYDASNKVD